MYTMPPYLLNKGSTVSGSTHFDGVDGIIVFAQNTAAAKIAAKAAHGSDSDDLWTDITPIAVVAGTDLEGWRLKVTVSGAAGQVNSQDIVEVTGAASATLDSIGTLAATALNGTPDIAASAYATGTNILTIAAIGDALGDGTVVAEFLPPLNSTMFLDSNISFPSFVGTIVDKGASGTALTLTLVDAAVPNIIAKYKQT